MKKNKKWNEYYDSSGKYVSDMTEVQAKDELCRMIDKNIEFQKKFTKELEKFYENISICSEKFSVEY